MKKQQLSHKGFTLIEMMLVISIIVFLIALSVFPYVYSMKRSYVEKSRDTLGQEWILAHKAVKNGKLFDAEKHANILLVFRAWNEYVEKYLFTKDIPVFTSFTKSSLLSQTWISEERLIAFDNKIELLSFRAYSWAERTDMLAYIIRAPYATGEFYLENGEALSSSGVFVQLWYTWASLEGGFAREMILRPYLQ
jgi:prepilin-type N-terminal cleavage/methylation domain-containing protein